MQRNYSIHIFKTDKLHMNSNFCLQRTEEATENGFGGQLEELLPGQQSDKWDLSPFPETMVT